MTDGLGIWKVKTIPSTLNPDKLMYQITRFDEPIGDPWIFKGHAVSEKTRLMRAEGLAVKYRVLASYEKK